MSIYCHLLPSPPRASVCLIISTRSSIRVSTSPSPHRGFYGIRPHKCAKICAPDGSIAHLTLVMTSYAPCSLDLPVSSAPCSLDIPAIPVAPISVRMRQDMRDGHAGSWTFLRSYAPHHASLGFPAIPVAPSVRMRQDMRDRHALFLSHTISAHVGCSAAMYGSVGLGFGRSGLPVCLSCWRVFFRRVSVHLSILQL